MTGSALVDFVITLIVLCGTGAMFFIAIDRMGPDETMKKIAKIAVGVVIAVVLLLAVKGLLFGGGGLVLTGGGIIAFAIGVIVILVLLYLIDLLLSWLAGNMGIGAPIVDAVKYLIFAIALIALLILADRTFFGGRYISGSMGLGETPSIARPERR